MKALRTLITFSLTLSAAALFAQPSTDCVDIVRTRDGSVYRGKVTERTPGGNLVIVTWSGLVMTIPESRVKSLVQKCRDEKTARAPYSFREHGLYNATRLGVLAGQSYYGDNTVGFSLYHAAGWMFNRWIGAGLGAGMEIYQPDGYEAPTYPIFAEVRGYFQGKSVTPFYSVAGGWAFTGKNTGERSDRTDDWNGGWLGKIQIGYRLGNHLAVYGGLSLQRKTRNWESVWGGEFGQDRILHKRLELGIGLLL